MYKEIILELYKNPRNFGSLQKPSHSYRLFNPLCGDDITIDIVAASNGTVKDIKFHGESCAISRASASLLTDYAKGKNLSELVKLDAGFMNELLGIEVSTGRVKCLLLPLEVIKKIV